MHQAEFDEIVALHEEWLESDGKSGRQAILENLDLTQVNLDGADLSNSVLKGSSFARARLANVRLCNADLQKAKFEYVSMENVDLSHCNLTGAKFEGSDMRGCILKHCHLSQANFRFANLNHTDLSNCNGVSPVFEFASLVDSIFNDIILYGAVFTKANLSRVKVENAMIYINASMAIENYIREIKGVDQNFINCVSNDFNPDDPLSKSLQGDRYRSVKLGSLGRIIMYLGHGLLMIAILSVIGSLFFALYELLVHTFQGAGAPDYSVYLKWAISSVGVIVIGAFLSVIGKLMRYKLFKFETN